jgi:hypothetical protein
MILQLSIFGISTAPLIIIGTALLLITGVFKIGKALRVVGKTIAWIIFAPFIGIVLRMLFRLIWGT